ncbi:phosphoribosylaminoimidazole-succinocarboxamide synthase [Methanocella paludicola SANAE]|uniref:Phosphoribosylaminoimidazole-succinocarboxamide synthase n=1 Tax=Methanocella paludicola (strain DSM 17711 / JCM 13418 / NBRC 101707 / SANAE) TaxID=304371 RepID=D1Z1Q8_METPS|nr:phosphoribosylaminoimidazolesuccinocarboxamide synthase [Methanocella paludicola]BAI62630.1 phosphoribosylaminoimidazole-succinocarboxamide synthase [Methanocella paludicola SANAE]
MIKGDALYSGKAKTVYATTDPKRYIVKFRDDVTAGDGAKKANMKGKGYYNAQISAKLFKLLADNGISTHYIKMVSEDEMLVHACDMVKIEVIPRNYAAGSIVRKYGFKEGQKFDPTLIVMDYKNDAAHDPMLNDDIAIALGIASDKEIRKIRKISLRVNEILQQFFDERGLLLPDFKLEFGKVDKKIVVADEISPDTMRLWKKDTRQSLDKDVFRFDKGDLMAAYDEAAKLIVPEIFK